MTLPEGAKYFMLMTLLYTLKNPTLTVGFFVSAHRILLFIYAKLPEVVRTVFVQ